MHWLYKEKESACAFVENNLLSLTSVFCRATASYSIKSTRIAMTGHFFEGAEKLLEIWFVTSENELGKATAHNDLRNIPR